MGWESRRRERQRFECWTGRSRINERRWIWRERRLRWNCGHGWDRHSGRCRRDTQRQRRHRRRRRRRRVLRRWWRWVRLLFTRLGQRRRFGLLLCQYQLRILDNCCFGGHTRWRWTNLSLHQKHNDAVHKYGDGARPRWESLLRRSSWINSDGNIHGCVLTHRDRGRPGNRQRRHCDRCQLHQLGGGFGIQPDRHTEFYCIWTTGLSSDHLHKRGNSCRNRHDGNGKRHLSPFGQLYPHGGRRLLVVRELCRR